MCHYTVSKDAKSLGSANKSSEQLPNLAKTAPRPPAPLTELVPHLVVVQRSSTVDTAPQWAAFLLPIVVVEKRTEVASIAKASATAVTPRRPRQSVSHLPTGPAVTIVSILGSDDLGQLGRNDIQLSQGKS